MTEMHGQIALPPVLLVPFANGSLVNHIEHPETSLVGCSSGQGRSARTGSASITGNHILPPMWP